jgi:hypothetical protein
MVLKVVSSAGGGSSGFPIVLGNTTIAAGSTTTAIGNLTLNNVTINGTNENNITFTNVNVTSGNIGNVAISNSSISNATITGGTQANASYSNVTITSGTFVGSNVKVSNGVYSTNTFNSVYTDGIVMDYATGNGRISVGAGDGITFYNGGVANVVLGNVTSGGVWNFNNLVSSNVSVTGGNVSANAVQYNTNTAATATFATPSLPLVPAGYLFFNLNGTLVKVPYYGV